MTNHSPFIQTCATALAALALLLAAPAAKANSGGMTGRSTPPGCNHCHSGGPIPKVTLTGPDTLESGETATYVLVMTGGAGVNGGLDVSVTNGATLTSIGTQGTRRFNREITHTSPKQFSNGEVRWEFLVTAPCGGARWFNINGAGNSVNGANRESGDYAGFAVRTVSVTPRECPDAGLLPDAGSEPDAELPEPDAGAVVVGSDAGLEPDEGGGCGCSGSGAGSHVVFFAGLALVLSRRARSA